MARSKRRRGANPSLVPRQARASKTLRWVYIAIIVGLVGCLLVSLVPSFVPTIPLAP
ncbi:MAG: hypothetical protein U0556_08985 [Dehalococcoidia bacterium]